MLLAVDVGNTNITVGWFRNAVLGGTRRATTNHRATGDELEVLLDGLLHLDGLTFADVSALVCASVVPAVTAGLEAVADSTASCPSCSPGSAPFPSPVRVDRPGEVGADRLVNALAAARLYGTPAVVADFGTATTFDCVAADGAYVGGAIAPGPGARPGGARRADGQAAADRAPHAGPGDRPGHRQRDAGRHHLRLPGPCDGPPRPGSARELAETTGVAPGEVRDDPYRRASARRHGRRRSRAWTSSTPT